MALVQGLQTSGEARFPRRNYLGLPGVRMRELREAEERL
jgi:hypothetical protein